MYNYQTERGFLFTEEGQVMFLRVRDNINSLLDKAGAVRMQEAISGLMGNSWSMLACVDRMTELGEIIEVSPSNYVDEYRVFMKRLKD